ncbi:hypothetical protein AA0472_1621 [Acetobacter estunensis NRIC 0472]|uniref:Uncharacterized protein n=1 Tax=Acetobacter estunensis TaxID=104097 RepID=A0A967BAF8_9PROT|nr:hypothetical protein [Acetobacter estunensis]NHO55309.1 hypothetical protein [Acetobacter estunensis]GBQ25036.1 hypothetical protein AA0472_1621 [Acetobacter estunensis NRIC 0472]
MPFEIDPEIDDPDYLFRYQSRRSLLHMQEAIGAYLSPSLWSGEHRHREYVLREPLLAKGHRIYTLSVWRNEALARAHFRRCSFSNETFVLMRIPRHAAELASLSWIDDDKLQREALLLFEETPWVNEQVYGSARIPWTKIEMTALDWCPLEMREEDRHVVVKHPYAVTYVHYPDDRNDYGLPQSEKHVRGLLRALADTERELQRLGAFQWLRRKELEAVRNSLFWQCHAIDRTAPSVRAALNRLDKFLPYEHPWRCFLGLFA